MWGFTRYNVLVKQVEGTADWLRAAAARVAADAAGDEIAVLLVSHLERAADHLDSRALRMLALYDPAARRFVMDGVKRDPRRPGVQRNNSSKTSGALDGPVPSHPSNTVSQNREVSPVPPEIQDKGSPGSGSGGSE